MTEASRRWLLSRIDRRCREAVDEVLTAVSEHLAIATADAVTIRVLAADDRALHPITAYHPIAWRGAAMAEAMRQTVQPVDTGLWQPVITTGRARRHTMGPGAIPEEASEAQQEFLRKHPVRAVLAAPVLAEGRVIGGVSVVRFGVDQPFTDEDEALVTEATLRIAPALELQRVLDEAEVSLDL